MVREDINEDQFIDVLLGNRKYVPCLYVHNKIDSIPIEEVDRLSRLDMSLAISCEADLNLDYLLERIWEELALVKGLWSIRCVWSGSLPWLTPFTPFLPEPTVYTKKRGSQPDLADPICLRKGATIEHVCHGIHRSIVSHFRYALVWGKSSKFSPQPQKVGLTHQVMDEDV